MSEWIVSWTVRTCIGIEDEGMKRFGTEPEADLFSQEMTAWLYCNRPTASHQIWIRGAA